MAIIKGGKSTKKRLLIFGIIVVGLCVMIGLLEVTNVTHFFHKHSSTVATTSSADTKGEAGDNTPSPATSGGSNSASGSDSSQPGDTKSDSGGASSDQTLLAPSGNFVSNHHPNLSGQPAPNTLTSVCTSTPGTSCQIIFTKDGVTKSLPSQTTDRGGSTYWNNWKLQDYGLTAGTWHIHASASLNGKVLGADDALDLVVAQ